MFRIEPVSINGFRNEDRNLISHYVAKMNEVYKEREEEIKKQILAYNFTQTNETNEEIYKKYISGSERGSISDGIWQLKVNAYWKRFSSAVAYTNVGSDEININMAKYNLKNEMSFIETLNHEYTHLAGLTHTFKYVSGREHSAPYAIGKILSKIYSDYWEMKESGEYVPEEPTPNKPVIVYRKSIFGQLKSIFLKFVRIFGT